MNLAEDLKAKMNNSGSAFPVPNKGTAIIENATKVKLDITIPKNDSGLNQTLTASFRRNNETSALDGKLRTTSSSNSTNITLEGICNCKCPKFESLSKLNKTHNSLNASVKSANSTKNAT